LALASAAAVVLIDVKSSPPLSVPGRAPMPPGVYAIGVVEGRTPDIELRPEASGRVVDVLVREGQLVQQGQVLLRLDDRTQQAKLAASLASLHLAQAQLERLVNGARPAERQEARALLAAKLAQLNQAQATSQRIQRLRAEQAVTQQEADDRDSTVRMLAAELDAAKARVSHLESPARDDELRAAQARVNAAKAQHELAALELDHTRLCAPAGGQVLEIRVEPGELIGQERREPVVVLADSSHLRVRGYIEEIDAPRVAVGARATITADGLPGRSFAGVVSSISPRMMRKRVSNDQPNELYDSKVRECFVEVESNAQSDPLILGLRVDVALTASNVCEATDQDRRGAVVEMLQH